MILGVKFMLWTHTIALSYGICRAISYYNHAKSEGNTCQVTFSNNHLNSIINFVILHNDNNGPFVLIRELNHFLLSVWPELLLDLSSCHLRCIPLTFGMVYGTPKHISSTQIMLNSFKYAYTNSFLWTYHMIDHKLCTQKQGISIYPISVTSYPNSSKIIHCSHFKPH